MSDPDDPSREDLYKNWMAWVTANLGGDPRLAVTAANAATDRAVRGSGFNDAAEAARAAWAQAAQKGLDATARPPGNGIVRRVAAGLAQGCVLPLLGFPFLVLSGECGSAQISGYQVLKGFDFPASEFNFSSTPVQVPHYGPNLFLAVLVAAVLLGVTAALSGGRWGAFIRLGTAALGMGMVFAALASLPSSIAVNDLTVFVGYGPGAAAIVLSLVVAMAVDGEAVVYWLIRSHVSHGPAP